MTRNASRRGASSTRLAARCRYEPCRFRSRHQIAKSRLSWGAVRKLMSVIAGANLP